MDLETVVCCSAYSVDVGSCHAHLSSGLPTVTAGHCLDLTAGPEMVVCFAGTLSSKLPGLVADNIVPMMVHKLLAVMVQQG